MRMTDLLQPSDNVALKLCDRAFVAVRRWQLGDSSALDDLRVIESSLSSIGFRLRFELKSEIAVVVKKGGPNG